MQIRFGGKSLETTSPTEIAGAKIMNAKSATFLYGEEGNIWYVSLNTAVQKAAKCDYRQETLERTK